MTFFRAAGVTTLVQSNDNHIPRRVVRFITDEQMDNAAFRTVFNDYAHRVYAYTLRMTACSFDAEDVLQETFLRCYMELADGRTIVDPLPWLLMVARHRVLNILRNRKHTAREPIDGSNPQPVLTGNLDADLDTEERAESIADAIAALPPPLREPFVLRYYENLDYESMADLLNDTPGALRTRVYRAKQILRRLLRHHHEGLLR